MVQQQGTTSPAAPTSEQISVSPSYGVLFSHFKELLDTAEAKITGYDELQTSLLNEKRLVQQLRQALQTQQRQIDAFVTQDALVSQLTRQLAAQWQTMEQLEANRQQQVQQSQSLQAQASASQRELGQTQRGLEQENRRKQQKIEQLEQQLEDYKAFCSYVMSQTQVRMTAFRCSYRSLFCDALT